MLRAFCETQYKVPSAPTESLQISAICSVLHNWNLLKCKCVHSPLFAGPELLSSGHHCSWWRHARTYASPVLGLGCWRWMCALRRVNIHNCWYRSIHHTHLQVHSEGSSPKRRCLHPGRLARICNTDFSQKFLLSVHIIRNNGTYNYYIFVGKQLEFQ